MKTNLIKLMTLIMVSAMLFVSCKKDDDTEPDNNNNPPVENKNNYLAAGSYGDVITYEIDEDNNSYSYTNETTGQSDSGTFTASSNSNLPGVYEVSIGGDLFYAVELAEKVFATSLPSGRAENKLCFGISSDLDLSTGYTASDIAGKYLFILYAQVSGEDMWGGYEINEDGTYTWQLGPNNVSDFNESSHFSGGGSGTWEISSTDPSKIIFTEGGVDYTGTIYPGKAMLIDNGIGEGFTLGIYYPGSHVSQSSIAGQYTYLDLTTDGYQGVGYYNIPSSGGTLDYYWKYNTTSIPEGSDSSSDFAAVPEVNNMFKTTSIVDSQVFTTYFVLLPGEVMLHFCEGETAGLVSYGIGAKIN